MIRTFESYIRIVFQEQNRTLFYVTTTGLTLLSARCNRRVRFGYEYVPVN